MGCSWEWFDLHNRGPLDLRPDCPAEAWDMQLQLQMQTQTQGFEAYESGYA